MPRIALLSEELVNKIAAGEVVERPASVVKELCENALDAGAREVRVSLSEGGLSEIAVGDDGQGMAPEDATLALSRHATSKLRALEDLFQLATLGFRGEALPAIASVSRFSLLTAERGAPHGTRVEVEGGGEPRVSDAPPIAGTRVEVRDLFFNTPARRKFMRRDQTELAHCDEAVVRLALAHPEVSFLVDHGGKPTLVSPACEADPRERIASALGPEAHRHLIEVDERRLGLRVHGFVAGPDFTLPNARGLYAFVNRRYVRDRGLNHALQQAFRDSLPHGRQPLVVLQIEMDPREVDANVHPQKIEVRFADARGVHDAVLAAVRRALGRGSALKPAPPSPPDPHYADAVERFLTRARGLPPLAEPSPLPLAAERPEEYRAAPAFGQARPELNEAPPSGYFAALRCLGSLGKRFWVCEGQGSTLVLVDPHAALERLRLHQLSQKLAAREPPNQSWLFGGTVELPALEAGLLARGLSALGQLGFSLEPFGGNAFAVKAVPAELEGVELRPLLQEIATRLPPEPSPPALFPSLRMMACHAARAGEGQISPEWLLPQLDRADFALSARHGAVVLAELPFLELERRSKN